MFLNLRRRTDLKVLESDSGRYVGEFVVESVDSHEDAEPDYAWKANQVLFTAPSFVKERKKVRGY